MKDGASLPNGTKETNRMAGACSHGKPGVAWQSPLKHCF